MGPAPAPAWPYLHYVHYVAAAAACYACVYLACRRWVAPERTPEFSCRLVTLLHALSSVALSAYCCLVVGPFPFTTDGEASALGDAAAGSLTPLQAATLSSSLGYFLFDLLWCLLHTTEGLVMLAHHLVSIATLGRALHSGRNAPAYLAGVGLLEATNPALQARWFLRTLGRGNTAPFYVADALFVAEFTAIRMVYGTVLLRRILDGSWGETEYLYSFVAIYVISAVFFVGIVRYVWRKYVKGSAAAADSNG